MSDYQLFLAFERGDYINLEDLPKITNYICGRLISCFPNERYFVIQSNYICGHLISWSPNQSHFEIQYNYVSKLTIVCH